MRQSLGDWDRTDAGHPGRPARPHYTAEVSGTWGESGMASSGRRNLMALAVAVLLPLIAGVLGAVATSEAVPTWYAGLAKPAWNPPPWLFAPVWTVLYVAMGVASWLVWRIARSEVAGASATARTALLLYAAQLVVNAAWSPTFFGLKRPDLALVVIVVLWVLVAFTTWHFLRLSRAAGLLLVPYAGWVTFATALNAAVWQLNR